MDILKNRIGLSIASWKKLSNWWLNQALRLAVRSILIGREWISVWKPAWSRIFKLPINNFNFGYVIFQVFLDLIFELGKMFFIRRQRQNQIFHNFFEIIFLKKIFKFYFWYVLMLDFKHPLANCSVCLKLANIIRLVDTYSLYDWIFDSD